MKGGRGGRPASRYFCRMARSQPVFTFAFHMLPQLVWRRPEAVRHELADPLLAPRAAAALRVGDKSRRETWPPPERVAPRGLQLSWHRVAGRATALLQLPAAQATGEAHLAAIVYEYPEADPATHGRVPDDLGEETDEPLPDEPDELLPRYFLLEATLGRSPDEAGTAHRAGRAARRAPPPPRPRPARWPRRHGRPLFAGAGRAAGPPARGSARDAHCAGLGPGRRPPNYLKPRLTCDAWCGNWKIKPT